MALIPNFASVESLSNNDSVTFSDSSTGTDSSITIRRLSIVLADGTYLVPPGTSTNYIEWSYSLPSITVDLLSKSTASTATCVWLEGSTPKYTKTIYMGWDLYDYVFLFGLLSNQTSQPDIINDTNYLNSFFTMVLYLWNAENAITKMDDVYSSQSNLDKNFYIMSKQNNYF